MRPLRAALFFILIAFMTTLGLSACGTSRYPESPQFRDGSFRNPVTPQTVGWRELPKVLWRFMFDKPAEATPAAPLPVASLTRAQLLAAPDRTLVRLGHSTVLMKLRGGFWLTDPVFSERASPVQWAGPKRFHPPPIAIDELPPIRGVVLSHDHYDHLDRAAILQLASRVDHFLAPLGVGDLLVDVGRRSGQGPPAGLVAIHLGGRHRASSRRRRSISRDAASFEATRRCGRRG